MNRRSFLGLLGLGAALRSAPAAAHGSHRHEGGEPDDPRHCWHWRAGHGQVERGGAFVGETWCCGCARVGLRKPRPHDLVPGHPLLTVDNADANGAEFVA